MWRVPQMQLLFVFVERDNEEVGEPVANYFGITGQETTVMPFMFVILFFCALIYLTETECSNLTSITLQVLAYTGNEDAKKFFLSGEMSLDNIKVIAEICLQIEYLSRSKKLRSLVSSCKTVSPMLLTLAAVPVFANCYLIYAFLFYDCIFLLYSTICCLIILHIYVHFLFFCKVSTSLYKIQF
jgi:hypothetical protein